MAVKIELKLSPMASLLAARRLDKTGQKQLASEVKRLCDPYVPMVTGTLKNTAQVLSDGVLYPQPYAARQYYTNGGSSDGHRGRAWDKRMLADRSGELTKAVAAFCGGEAK